LDIRRNILIIVQNLPVPFDRRVWQEATTLRESGFGVTVICPKKKMYVKSYEQLEGVEIYRYPMLYDADRASIGFFLEFAFCWLATFWLAVKVYIRQPFHVIQACNPPDTYFALALLFRPLGVKFVFDHHDLCPEMYVAKGKPSRGVLYRGLLLLERLTLRSADAVIAVNQSHYNVALRRGGVDPGKIRIVRSGPRGSWSEIKAFRPELKQGRKFLVVFLGEMGSQDGVDLLLRSIRHYADQFPRDVLFTLIGGGPEQHRMEELARELGLEEWVEFTGRVAQDHILWQYLSTADLCIAPEPLTEYGDLSTANKIIEYMAFGKPIVAFDLTEHRRSAADAAFYVEPNDHVNLSAATRELLINEELRMKMGERARQRFRNELSWERSANELLAMYSRLLGVEPTCTPTMVRHQESSSLSVKESL
jgi:glycosyltransferase involved in cell wall biosynthesis